MNSILICDVSMHLFEAILLWFYCESLFKSRFKKVQSFLMVLLGYIILFLAYQLGNPLLNALLNIIVIFSVIKFLYDEKIKISLLHTFLYYLFLVGAEFVVMPMLAVILNTDFFSYQSNEVFYIIASIISKLVHLLCCVIIIIIYQRIKKHDNEKGYAITLIIPVTNIIVLVLIAFAIKDTPIDKKMYHIWTISAVLILISSILVFYNRSYLIRQSEKINELNIENQKKELDEQYFSVLEKSNDDMQILAHDFKNHLSYVRHLDSAEEKDKYIDKVYPEIEKFQQTASTGNNTLDVILSKYTSICALKAIDFKTDVKNANLAQVESVDLIALLNNLLDNAVEAAETSAAKRITLTLVKDTQFMDKLVITNSCDTAPAQSGDKLLTRKKEGALHGSGLKSVKKVCEQCGANYAWEYDSEERLFTTTVLMPKEQKSN